jgi:nicotinate-nucleotide adenylyltransferase
VAGIGLLGGTFDPVHYGHLRLAIEALEGLPIDSLWFVPLHQPNHRRQPSAPGNLRKHMLEAALSGAESLGVDDRELRRGGVSYTVETLSSLRAEHPAKPLVWIMGMDSFASLPAWHRWRELIELAHLVVASRPGAGTAVSGELAALLERRGLGDTAPLGQTPAGKLFILEMPMLDISSSNIRSRISAGRSARYLTPDPVLELIEEHGLYRDEA